MSYLDSLSLNLQRYTEIIVKQLRFQSYHFVELFIYFNNFIENEAIEEESFVTANTTLLNPEEEDEDEVDSLSKNIFEKLSLNDKASITALSCYLKKISISTSCEFDADVLFALLDKDNKGYIDSTDIEIIISSLEDFIDEKGDWTNYEKALANKKIIKKDLLQTNFFQNIKKLFKKAGQVIENRIDKLKKIEEEEQLIQAKAASNNKANKSKSKSKSQVKANRSINNNPENSKVTIYNKTEAIPKLKSPLLNNQRNNINININNNNINANTNANNEINHALPLDEILFDRTKLGIVHKIKQSTYLYDINYNSLINELSVYEPEPFSKEKFIDIMCKIIAKKTSDLLVTPIMKMALSMFFQIIDSDKKNQITFYEALGAMLPLTKNINQNDKVKHLYKYPRPLMYQLLQGTFSIFLNTNMIKDLRIFSEIVFQKWDEDKIRNETDLFKWVFNLTTPKKGNPIEYQCKFPLHSPTAKEISDLIDSIKQKYDIIRGHLMIEISQLSILKMTQRIIKYSFLGVINSYQLNELFEVAIEEKYTELEHKTKEKIKDNWLAIIEQHFAFTRNELIDVTHLQAFCMLFFSGSTIEKFQSIFEIFDLKDNEPIEYDDLYEYLSYLFGFVIKQTQINWCDCKTLAKIICDYIIENVDKKITLTCLMQVYDIFINMNSIK